MSSRNISKLLYKQRVESRKSFSYNMSLSASCWSYEVCLKSNGTECAVWGIGERGISRLGYHIIWYFGVYNCNLSLEFVFFGFFHMLLWQDKLWLLHHGNVPAHNVPSIWQFQAKKNVVLEQSSYSPDVAAGDFFPRLKGIMTGTRFEAVEAIKRAVTTELRGHPRRILPTMHVAEKDGKRHYTQGGLLWRGNHVVVWNWNKFCDTIPVTFHTDLVYSLYLVIIKKRC